LLSKDKQFAAAMEKLKLLAERYPNQKNRLLLTKAEVLNQQKQYQQAYAMLSEALVESPDNKDLLYSRALMADRLEKIDSAEADFKKILAKSPDSPDVLNALGYTLVEKTKRYAEAEQYLLHALKLSPNEAVILDSYGWLQFKKGNLPSALDYLQRAYDKQKESEIVAHLAEVLWVLGKKDEAKKLFKEAFKQDPNDEYLLEFKQRVLDKDS
jgi:Tfp pilus assembly protein PilF